jgi:hypothetical protein
VGADRPAPRNATGNKRAWGSAISGIPVVPVRTSTGCAGARAPRR